MNQLFQKIVTMLRNSNTTQHNTTQHNTTQHNTTQHNTTQGRSRCFLLLICVFFTTRSIGQTLTPLPTIPDTPTYYDLLKYYTIMHPAVDQYGVYHEGGVGAKVRKDAILWSPRVFPTGNVNLVSSNIQKYASDFNEQLNVGNYNCDATANWKCIGPTGPVSFFTGQLQQIRFSPNYLTDNTIYACSTNGGLWKSTDKGDNWSVTSTDKQLPFTSVSDIAIDPINTQVLYIGTGESDRTIGHYGFNISNSPMAFTPIFTGGVYRSVDGGANWRSINGTNQQLLNFFPEGTVIRRIKLHPTDNKKLYITTGEGVFMTSNCHVDFPVWSKITSFEDKELKGLEFKPNDPNTIYVSGRDVYKSVNGGTSWTSMTGSGTGLNYTSLGIGTVQKINIAVTPANPNKLYAYIIGAQPLINTDILAFISIFNGTTWVQATTNFSPPGHGSPYRASINKSAIAVSPTNENAVYIGITDVLGSNALNGNSPINIPVVSPYLEANQFHADVVGLTFEPKSLNVSSEFLFAATDGGIHKCDINGNNMYFGWIDKSVGLQLTTSYSFDDTEDSRERIITGNQDTGTSIFKQSAWAQIEGGDGFVGQIDGVSGQAYGHGNYSMFSYTFPNNSPNPENEHINRPTEIDGSKTIPAIFDIINHPKSERMIFGFSELFERIPPLTNFNWKIKSDIANGGGGSGQEIAKWRRQLNAFAISESNPDYIFFAVPGQMVDVDPSSTNTTLNQPYTSQPRLLSSITGGCTGFDAPNPASVTSTCFHDITQNLINSGIQNSYHPINNPNLPQLTIPVITDIIYHPEDHLKAWICFTGYEANVKVWKTIDGGITWTNADPNSTLNNLPVNCMVFQKGTKEGIYIGTDAGVWFKNEESEDWTKFCDFPNVRVTKLKINYCMGKIRAATFGRSIWEGDLIETDGLGKSELVIDATTPTNWNISRGLDRNLRIKKGSVLNITGTSPSQKIKISMPKDSYIIVEDGARLNISNAILTNNCGNTWKGIELWGNKNLSQTPTSNQGYIALTNAEIEHALDAVKVWGNQDPNKSGGIIEAFHTIFRNNKRAIEYFGYENWSPFIGGNISPNKGVFKNCEFTVNDETRFNGHLIGHVTMWGVRGVSFLGCNFNDSRSANVPFKINGNFGILSIDASPIIKDYSSPPFATVPKRSVFKGLNCGINSSSGGAGNHSLTVHHTDFSNNVIGVYTDALNNNQIRGCTFSVGKTGTIANAPEAHEGLVLMHETNFTVDNNSFEPVFPTAEPVTVGIRVLDAGMDANIIYRNTFTKSNTNSLNRFHANLSNGNNRNTKTGGGLQYLCNTNTNNLVNGFDFAVTGNGFVSGIAFQQGNMGNPAENTFSLGTNLMGSDFFNEGNLINYYFRNTSGVFEPQNVSGAILKISTGIPQATCQNDFALIAPPVIIKNSYFAEETTRNVKESLLAALIDGGNTENLFSKVADAKPSTKEAIKSQLISTSPYLSEKVVNKVTERGEFFTKPFVNQIVTLNPDAVSEDTWIQMKNSAGFSDQEIITLKANINTITTPRTVKIQELEGLNQSLNKKAVQIIHGMKLDTLGYYNDSLIVWYQKMGGIGAAYQIADTYLDAKQYDNAMDFLSGIPSQYGLSESELHEFDFYSDIKKMQVEAAIINTILTSSPEAIQKLETIVNNSKGLGAAYAKEQLNFALGTSYYTPPVLPSIGTQNRPSERNNEPAADKIAIVKAIPNPANTIVRFDVEFPNDTKYGRIIITNNSGKIVGNMIAQLNTLAEYNTSTLPNGIYYYQLDIEGKPQGEAKKLIILHQ